MPWHATHNRIEALRKRRVPADRPGPAQGLRSATIGITHCSAGSWCPTAPSIRPSRARGGDQGRYFGRNKKTITLSRSKPEGQALFCRLVETLYAVPTGHAVSWDQLGLPGKRYGNRTTGSAPRNTYRTKDDRLGMAEGEFERLQGAGVV